MNQELILPAIQTIIGLVFIAVAIYYLINSRKEYKDQKKRITQSQEKIFNDFRRAYKFANDKDKKIIENFFIEHNAAL